MFRSAFYFAAIGLSGCATVTSMREGTPFVETKAERPSADVAACVALAWGQTRNFHTRTERSVDHTNIILAGSTVAGSDMVASIYDDGRVLMFRRKAAWGKLDDERAADVKRCSVYL